MQFRVRSSIINLAFKDSKCANIIKSVEGDRIRLAIVTANNHYAGFGPGTVNIFRDMLGLPEAKWQEKEEEQEQQHEAHNLEQRTLSEFLN